MSVHARLVSKPLVLAVYACVVSSAAHAVDRTRYVSINGNNNNDCTLAAPCRTLQRGIDETPAGGELRILDSGVSANNVTIGKSLTISGDGHTVFPGTSSMTIDAAGAVVTLRELTLRGRGPIEHGINIVSAAMVHVERCTIHGFNGSGIFVAGTADGVSVFVLGTVSRDNGLYGLSMASTGALTVDNSHLDNNGEEGIAVESAYATINRSTASGNAITGIRAVLDASVNVVSTVVAQNGSSGFFVASGATMTVESSLAQGNGFYGLHAATPGVARVSNSTFTGNAIGIRNNSIVETRQNNTVRGNVTDLSGSALTAIGGV